MTTTPPHTNQLTPPRPWLADVFKVSSDPDFEAKLRDVIGLYVNPPEARRGVQLRRKDPDPGP